MRKRQNITTNQVMARFYDNSNSAMSQYKIIHQQQHWVIQLLGDRAKLLLFDAM
jgi:hypothetical protein